MRTSPRSRPGVAAPTRPEVRLHVGRLVLDAAAAGSDVPDAATFGAWLEREMASRLGGDARPDSEADRPAAAVGAVADAIVAHVRPAVGRAGGA
jgi:hypothetical protein